MAIDTDDAALHVLFRLKIRQQDSLLWKQAGIGSD